MMSLRSLRLAAVNGLLVWIIATTAHASDAALPSVAPESVGFSSERLRKLDEYFQRLVTTGGAPGATFLVARHGKVVKFDAYGKADAERGTPMRRDALFRIYSQTKPVTGVALMILYEEAKWRFEDPITRFIPEFTDLQVFEGLNADGSMRLVKMERPPTMREVLTHTAGFAYGLGPADPVDKAYYETNFMRSANAQEAIQRLARLPLASQPGQRWRYSAAVDIQGYIVERLSGQTLADFMRTRIFEPLGMQDTAFYVPSSKTDRLVTLRTYDAAAKALAPATGMLVFDYSKPPGTASGGAGLVSTTSDYALFAQMLLNGGELNGARILVPSTVQLLSANHVADPIRAVPRERFSEDGGMGFGVDLSIVMDSARAGTTQGQGTVSWTGAAGTWFWVDPAHDLFVLGMTQVMNRRQSPALRDIEAETSAMVYAALVAPEK